MCCSKVNTLSYYDALPCLQDATRGRPALLRPVLGITSVNCTRLTWQTCTVPSALGQMIRKMGLVIFRNTELCNTVTR
jgi:hypothetical protein